MRLKIIRTDNSITHLALSGRLDVQGVNDIQYEFLHQTNLLPKPTLVDVSKMTYIASLGIGMLLGAAKHVERNGAKFVLLNPSPLVKETLKIAGFDQMLVMADDEKTALHLLRVESV